MRGLGRDVVSTCHILWCLLRFLPSGGLRLGVQVLRTGRMRCAFRSVFFLTIASWMMISDASRACECVQVVKGDDAPANLNKEFCLFSISGGLGVPCTPYSQCSRPHAVSSNDA